jgi:hypothetical protein
LDTLKYFDASFGTSSYTPEMIDALGAAQDKLKQAMSTSIDNAGHDWWSVIMQCHPAIFSVGYAADPGSVTPHLVVEYDPRMSLQMSPPSMEQILGAKGTETTLGDWLITNGLDPTTLVIQAGCLPRLRRISGPK